MGRRGEGEQGVGFELGDLGGQRDGVDPGECEREQRRLGFGREGDGDERADDHLGGDDERVGAHVSATVVFTEWRDPDGPGSTDPTGHRSS